MKEQWETNWKDYYRVFGLPKTATSEEIKSAYRKLMVEYHPNNVSDEEKAMAHKMCVLLNEAYEILADKEKRAKYDAVYDEKKKTKSKAIIPKDDNKPKDEDEIKNTKKGFFKKHKKGIIIAAIIGVLVTNKIAGIVSDLIKDDNTQDPIEPSIEDYTKNPTEAPLEVNGQEIVINETTKKPVTTPKKESTPTPVVEATAAPVVEATPTPTVEVTPSVDDALQKEIDDAAETIYNNWQNFNSEYSKETIVELIKVLNNQPSTMSIETADEIIRGIVERAVTPGINNAFAGQAIYETHQIDLSSLLVGDKSGYSLVRSMELDLNGALVDPANLMIYGERAFTDEALMIGENQAIDGISAYSGNPVARMLWARLAIGTNGIVGSLGDDLTVTINDTVYSQDDLNNATVLEDIIRNAKVELGNTSKTMSK